MAQTVQILLRCDLHEEKHEADETIVISFAGKTVEIDLCKPALDDLTMTLGPFMALGRRQGGTPRATPSRRPRAKAAAAAPTGEFSKDDRAEIREWARANGIQVGERGRLPREAYEGWARSQQQTESNGSAPKPRRSKANA